MTAGQRAHSVRHASKCIMTYHFFRKERPEVFKATVSVPEGPTAPYKLKSSVIFKAKNADGSKLVTVVLKGRPVKLKVSVQGTKLVIKNADDGAKPAVNTSIEESAIASLLELRRQDTVEYLTLKQLCQTHAKASTSSPFISGCVENNFEASKAYAGFKIHLELNTRQPFKNPFVSGTEKEYFLVGRVSESDCKWIRFLGEVSSTKNESVSQIVNTSQSDIPRPPPDFKAKPAAPGVKSMIPVPRVQKTV